ncbi:MAG: 50S ribosomal protein L16 [Planctomycetota bacterium]
MPPYKIPKRVKFRKEFRRTRDRKATKGNYVAFGDYGLQALEGCWLKSNVIEAGRIACMHFLKREGKLFIRVFPDKPVSKKPLETRMGKGKADVDYWAARVKEGTVLYELAGVSEERARGAMLRMARKMPVRCRFVKRRVSV